MSAGARLSSRRVIGARFARSAGLYLSRTTPGLAEPAPSQGAPRSTIEAHFALAGQSPSGHRQRPSRGPSEPWDAREIRRGAYRLKCHWRTLCDASDIVLETEAQGRLELTLRTRCTTLVGMHVARTRRASTFDRDRRPGGHARGRVPKRGRAVASEGAAEPFKPGSLSLGAIQHAVFANGPGLGGPR